MKKILIQILLFVLLIQTNLFSQFAGGAGTSVSPYQISTVTHLNNVRNYLSSYFILVNNIDVSSAEFTPIGTEAAPFTGSLNGNSFTIKNAIFINYYNLNNAYYGLFSLTSGATITNLCLESCTIYPISGYDPINPNKSHYNNVYAGMLAGKSTNTTITNINIKNQYSLVADEVGSGVEYNYHGGLIGQLNSGTVTSCSVWGGLIKNNSYTNSSCALVIYTGGLIGYSLGTHTKCNAVVGMYVSYWANSGSSGIYNQFFGGCFGLLNGSATNCYAITNITYWYPNGTVGAYKGYPAGFVGTGTGTVSKCYSRMRFGTVYNKTYTIACYFNSSLFTGSTSNCIATDDYYSTFTIKGMYDSYTENADTISMKDQILYTSKGFDFINTWSINGAKNYGYPYLISTYTESTTPLPPVPTIYYPTNGQTNVSVSSTQLIWSVSSLATSYYYEIIDALDNIVTSGYTTTASKTLNNVLDYSTTYQFRVANVNAAGSTFSGYNSFTTEQFTGTLVAPILTYPTADTTGFVLPYSFRWNSVSGAAKYDYELWKSDGALMIDSTQGIINTYLSQSGTLENGNRYRWRVRATNGSNSSLWSERYFTASLTLPSAVTLVYPTANDTGITINSEYLMWNKVPGASKYYIDALDSLTGSSIYQAWVNSPDTTFIISSDSGFIAHNWYRWRVKANNSLGDGTYSNYRKFKTGVIYNGEGTNPNLPSLLTANCLGGYGGILTEEKRDTLTWNWCRFMTNGEYVKEFGFNRSSTNNSQDTIYIPINVTSSPKDVSKLPSWRSQFIYDNSNSTFMTDSTQWFNDGGMWIYNDIGNDNTLGAQINNQVSGNTLQIDSVNFISTWLAQYPSYYYRPHVIWVSNGVATLYTAPFAQYLTYYGDNFSKPMKINDSLFIPQVCYQTSGAQNGSTYTYTFTDYIICWNKNTNVWKRFNTINTDSTQLSSWPNVKMDKIGGLFQLDTIIYFYTMYQDQTPTYPLDRIKIWAMTTTGVNKLFSSADLTALDTITDYNMVWNSDIEFAGTADTNLSVVVNYWTNTVDCEWYFQVYNRVNNYCNVYKFDGTGVTKITHPNLTLKLSSAYLTPDGTDLFMIYQDWTNKGGGSNAIGYKIHTLTNVVDTFNIPTSTVDSDTTGLLNYCKWYNGKLYLTSLRSSVGFIGPSIMSDTYMKKIFISDYEKAERDYPKDRSIEIKIKGIKPKSLRKTRLE